MGALTELDSELMDALWSKEVVRARELIEAGANPRARTDSGWTALMSACQGRSIDCVNLILDMGAEADGVDERSRATALHLAVAGNLASVVGRLISAGGGACLKLKDNLGLTVIGRAIFEDSAESVSELLAHGMEIDERFLTSASMFKRTSRTREILLAHWERDALDLESKGNERDLSKAKKRI